MKNKYKLFMNGNFEAIFIERDELKKHISKKISKILDEEGKDLIDIRIIRFSDINQKLSKFGFRYSLKRK